MSKRQGPSKETLEALKNIPIYCMMCGQLLEHPHLCTAGAAPELEHLRTQNATLLAALEGLGLKCRQCREWHRLGCEHLFTIKHPSEPMPICDEACETARAAIAQAKETR